MFSWKSGNHVFVVFFLQKTARLLSQAKLLQRSLDVVPHKSPSPLVFEGPVLKLFQDVPRHQVPHRQWKVMRTFPEPKHSSWHSPGCWSIGDLLLEIKVTTCNNLGGELLLCAGQKLKSKRVSSSQLGVLNP